MTPRLRALLLVTLVLFALLALNSIYLGGVSLTEWSSGQPRQNGFYQSMFLAHLVLGLLITVPSIAFGIWHWKRSHDHPNRRAVRMGLVTFGAAIIALVTGIVLTHVDLAGLTIELKQPGTRALVYWLHVATPVIVVWAFVLHRLAGRRIRWRTGLGVAVAAVALVVGFDLWHRFDAARARPGPKDGAAYFDPSLARTANGSFIPEQSLSMNDYCLSCHPDAYKSWAHSAHAASSFNNPMYAFSVRETRRQAFEREGSVQDARFCAGCHDPVPFFTGAFAEKRFDDPAYDVSKDPMGAASITCTSCHSITSVGSTRGNADYVIEESAQYPFTFSESPFLRWVNRQLIKAKPAFHKQTYMKPQVHRSAEFCSTCHKVFLPESVNNYKWLPGQNHYDSWRLSGRSGHGIQGWYWPKDSALNCNGCHMPAVASTTDFGAKPRGPDGELRLMDHQFLGANTALPALAGQPDAAAAQAATERFNRDVLRLDLFAVRAEGRADGTATAPLGDQGPALEPGKRYLLEAVTRTLGTIGHEYTQGTADSNETWLEVTLRDGDRIIGRLGGMTDAREGHAVDPWAKFFNVYMLDRNGFRIDRRNPQDIFVPLYNQQIPPGAADVTRLAFTVPASAQGPITIEAAVRYRKFDTTFMRHVFGKDRVNDLPVMTLASDRVTFPVAGSTAALPVAAAATATAPGTVLGTAPATAPGTATSIAAGAAAPPAAGPPKEVPAWERWHDAAIGLFRIADRAGDKGQWAPADEAFARVAELGKVEGWIGRARVALRDGRLEDAAQHLRTAAQKHPGDLPWAVTYWSAVIDLQQGAYERAAEGFRTVAATAFTEAHARGYDFSRDDRMLVEWATANLERSRQLRGAEQAEQRRALLEEALTLTDRALAQDSQRFQTWYVRAQTLQELGDAPRAAQAMEQYNGYRPDDNAAIYDLQRPGAPGLAPSGSTTPVAVRDRETP